MTTDPSNLIEALARWLESDAAVTAELPGGWYNGAADRDAPLPFGVLVDAGNEQPLRTFIPGQAITNQTVQLQLVADAADTAKQLAELVGQRLLPRAGYQPERLTWPGGSEVSRWKAAGGGTSLDDTRGPDGVDVWVASLPVTFKTVEG